MARETAFQPNLRAQPQSTPEAGDWRRSTACVPAIGTRGRADSIVRDRVGAIFCFFSRVALGEIGQTTDRQTVKSIFCF